MMKQPPLLRSAVNTTIPPALRRLTWLNIVMQASFPLAVTFMPEIAVAEQPPAPAHSLHQRTQVYILGAGESAASVAQKYHLTLEQLRQLNASRIFAHSFDHLRQGDSLDVPVTPLPVLAWGSNTQPSETVTRRQTDEQQEKVASLASQAGSFLSNKPDGEVAASMVQGMAAGAASSEMQQWLSRWGTARVQLDMDKSFSLKNSQFELLVPLYDRGSDMVFTQGSLHRTDDRTQSNLGLGIRHFTPGYMLGGNLFGDYDLSRDHARAGLGMEYWRNFLKLGINSYLRLTGWKNSPDLTDYEERPANGWDVRAQAWLPSLPQLGGKLTYEQYYGKEVALFGVDHRQQNPRAVTVGITYTPVPLLTLSAERRQGEDGRNDSRLGVDIRYQPGVPFGLQLNPDAVAAMRSLVGSRYDLVERNNNIVLEYRKKDVIRLHIKDLVTGYAGDQKSLGVSVTSKYGLSHIDWSAPSLMAAGGKIIHSGEDYDVVLPIWHDATQSVNSYTVSGVAVDIKGNRSARQDTQVTVLAPEVNKDKSTFTPASSTLPADGKSTQVLTLALKNKNGQPVDVSAKDISLSSGTLKSAKISALARKSAGVYVTTVTAGTDSETVTVTPSVRGETLSPAVVNISIPAPGDSQFTAAPDTLPADNSTWSTLTLVAKDAQGHPLTGLKNSLAFIVKDKSGKIPAPGTITLGDISESTIKGVYTATLRGTLAGKYTVMPEFRGCEIGNLRVAVTLTAAAPAQARSAITTDKVSYVLGDNMAVKVMLKDAAGNPVTGDKAALTADAVKAPDATIRSGSGWKDNGDGTYTATYIATTVGTGLKATLRLAGWSGTVGSEAYVITAPVTIKDIAVNGYTFAKDAGFPTTGYKGAQFTLELSKGSASDYNWKADAPWVSVSNGVVTFTGVGTRNRVTITGTPKNGKSAAIAYSFSLRSWFIDGGGSNPISWSDANAYCSSQPGYALPTVQQLSGTPYRSGTRGVLGGVWSEWGYIQSGLPAGNNWSSDPSPHRPQGHYYVSLFNGKLGTGDFYSVLWVSCRKAL